MTHSYQIIDADCHVWEPADLWETYLEPEAGPHKVSDTLELDGEALYHKISASVAGHGAAAMRERNATVYGIRDYDSPSHVKAIKTLGAECAFLYPSVGGWLFAVDSMDAALAGALVSACATR